MKLHVGTGAIYLRDFVNVDLPLPSVFLSKERPDIVEKFITTESDYYGRHTDKHAETLRGGALKQETACDAYGSFAFLPARSGTVSELLSRQVFEHLDKSEGREALKEAARVLKVGGILRLDIPDPDETLRLYRKTGDEFYIRHLFGPRLNQYGFHTHYTRPMLRTLVEAEDFQFVEEEHNIHFYPAFCLKWRRV